MQENRARPCCITNNELQSHSDCELWTSRCRPLKVQGLVDGTAYHSSSGSVFVESERPARQDVWLVIVDGANPAEEDSWSTVLQRCRGSTQ